MAETTITVCDPCAALDTETRAFDTLRITHGGTAYIVDVCEVHAEDWKKLQETAARFVARARPEAPKRRSRGNTEERRQENAAVRRWAAAEGIELSPRGRIPYELRARWAASGEEEQS